MLRCPCRSNTALELRFFVCSRFLVVTFFKSVQRSEGGGVAGRWTSVRSCQREEASIPRFSLFFPVWTTVENSRFIVDRILDGSNGMNWRCDIRHFAISDAVPVICLWGRQKRYSGNTALIDWTGVFLSRTFWQHCFRFDPGKHVNLNPSHGRERGADSGLTYTPYFSMTSCQFIIHIRFSVGAGMVVHSIYHALGRYCLSRAGSGSV